MHKLWASIKKELLLLSRDLGGLLVLFLMPVVLIITVTLIQDSTFSKVGHTHIPVLFVSNDTGYVSRKILGSFDTAGSLIPITEAEGRPLTEASARALVARGRYQMALVIPANLTRDLEANTTQNVASIMSKMGMGQPGSTVADTCIPAQKEVRLYFDPAMPSGYRVSVMNAVDKMVSQIETKAVYQAFQGSLGTGIGFRDKSFITFREISAANAAETLLPNSVQHNLSAWTLFAIFFIVIPLSINIVKEKSQGTAVRLLTQPVGMATVFAGKVITYLLIAMAQFYLMVAVAVFLFPSMGLPPLNIGGHLALMSVVALFSGLAAIGYGVLIGTVAKTQEQSAPFGSTSVIILAAIGGVWVPVFAMPKAMQAIAKASPMNWGLNAFYDVMLRNCGILDLLPEIGLLVLFFALNMLLALLYDHKKRAV